MARVQHPLNPIWNGDSRVLILGTMPSPQSRKKQFYYAHPQNRFWKVMAAVLEEEYPETNDAKQAMLLRRGIALWDVLLTCDIQGASDQSIRNPQPNDIGRLLEQCPIRQVFTTGRRAFELYASLLGGESICLPSPSAANCAASLEQLVQCYRVILPYLNEKQERGENTRCI